MACANSMGAIGGERVCSLVWTRSTTMREKLAPFGQVLQNTPNWLVQAWTIAQGTCNLLSPHNFSLLPFGCTLLRYKVVLQPITLVDTIFSLINLKESTQK